MPTTVAFDFETWLIEPGMLTPPAVCMTWATADEAGIALPSEGALTRLAAWLRDPAVVLVGANVTFDLAVVVNEDPDLLPLVFAALEAGRIKDVQLRQKLMDIAVGYRKFRRSGSAVVPAKYDLASLVALHLNEHLEKEDTWRLRYRELDGVPLVDWPQAAKDYPILDAVKTLQVYDAQEADLRSPSSPWVRRRVPPLADEAHQMRAAWALHLMSVWGNRTDPTRVDALERSLQTEVSRSHDVLTQNGLMRVKRKKDGTTERSKNLKAIRALVVADAAARGVEPIRTDKGDVSTARETLEQCEHPDLMILAGIARSERILSAWMDHLKNGAVVPLNPRYDVILETGRTSCTNPPMQTPPRSGGVRECFVPRAGYLFADCDYDTLELRALAHACLELVGFSAMADALRRGEDLHLNLAADLMGITREAARARYADGDKEVDEARQLCKIANFGFPGGMVPATFMEYAAGFGRSISLGLARSLHDAWKKAWPEMDRYFRIVKGIVGAYGSGGQLIQLGSKRIRGDVNFCAGANSFFQGLAADGAKEALWRLSKECYLDQSSPLYGSRPALFLHDEIIVEVPEAAAHEAAERLGVVMREAMAAWIPSVPIGAKPSLMRRWFKGSKAIYVDGRLVPVKPVTFGKTVKWEPDIPTPASTDRPAAGSPAR